jgi:hypothetical protein
VRALQAVDTDVRNLVPDGVEFNEFLWPNPHIFLSQTSKTYECITSYLSIREAWRTVLMDKFSAVQDSYSGIGFTKKGWRACLNFDTNSSDAPTIMTRTQRRKQKHQHTFAARLSGASRPAFVVWNGTFIQCNDNKCIALIVTEVVWELFEANFRFEIMLLDCCVIEGGLERCLLGISSRTYGTFDLSPSFNSFRRPDTHQE